jgi:hypothetical protein
MRVSWRVRGKRLWRRNSRLRVKNGFLRQKNGARMGFAGGGIDYVEM